MYLHVETSTGNDTLIAGVEGSILFRADSSEGWNAYAFSWPLLWTFSNGNVVGSLIESANVQYSPQSLSVFESIMWDSAYGAAATDPDTTLLILLNFGGSPDWTSSSEVWRLKFIPLDTGRITVDSAFVPPSTPMAVVDAYGSVDFTWEPKTIVVVSYCAVQITGDTNANGSITASDIIELVNFLFKGGPTPRPCEAGGDVDCSSTVDSSDIISLVGYVFKGSAPLCNVCSLVRSGAWPCD